MSDKEAFEKIIELCKPGQTIKLSDATDIICDVWNIAKDQIKSPAETAQKEAAGK